MNAEETKKIYIKKIENRLSDLSLQDLRKLYDILTSML